MSQPQTFESESGERGKTMKIDILKEYAALEAMETKELLQVWNRHFDAPPQSRNNRTYLINQIIYRMQELAYGGLTKSTIDRLEALAEGKTVQQRRSDVGRLAVGTRLVREVKGVEHHVYVLADGYEYQGLKYKSLSGVAFAITGTRWNGKTCAGLPRLFTRSEAQAVARERSQAEGDQSAFHMLSPGY